MITSPIETATGLTTVIVLREEAELPRLDIIWTIMRPTTSSSMAALVRITPRRVVINPLVLSTVNVVPRLLKQIAAPAANDCSGVAIARPSREKDNAMGKLIPVTATPMESNILAFKERKVVERPPIRQVRWWRHGGGARGRSMTFIHEQNETEIAKLNKDFFC